MSTITKRVTTVNLEGSVKEVKFDREYPYFEVANMGSAPVYLSKYEDISAGTDGVYTVSAGSSIVARMDSDTVYVSGSGVVQIAAKYEAEHSFKSAAKGGDSPAVDAYTKAETDILLANKFNAEKVVDALPENPDLHTLYIVDDDTYIYTPVQDIPHELANYGSIEREKFTKIMDTAGNYIVCTYKQSENKVYIEAYYDGTLAGEATPKYSASGDIIQIGRDGDYFRLKYAYNNVFNLSTNKWIAPFFWYEKIGGGWLKIGNAYTQTESDELFAKKMDVVGENLLINPDFRINQRGQTTYTGYGYTVDRWTQNVGAEITVTDSGIKLDTETYLTQVFESDYSHNLIGHTLTMSCSIDGTIYSGSFECNGLSGGFLVNFPIKNGNAYVYGNGNTLSVNIHAVDVVINFVKLEVGSAATLFVHPNPTAELLKCQRYYQIRSADNISAVDLRPSMVSGVVPTVTAVLDGYAYSTEL